MGDEREQRSARALAIVLLGGVLMWAVVELGQLRRDVAELEHDNEVLARGFLHLLHDREAGE